MMKLTAMAVCADGDDEAGGVADVLKGDCSDDCRAVRAIKVLVLQKPVSQQTTALIMLKEQEIGCQSVLRS